MADQFVDLSENQARQLIDAQALYRAYRTASSERLQTRGSMIWRELRGVRYLIRTSSTGSQKVLGPFSQDTDAIFTRFHNRKEAAKIRYKALSEKLLEQKKLNRVYRVGRAPNILIKILQTLEKFGIEEEFLVVGTHAMYAYESACGVQLLPANLATRDVDLLFDIRKRNAFEKKMRAQGKSLMTVLKDADPTFKLDANQLYTATNNSGFEVDIIRRLAKDSDPHPYQMTAIPDDLWAVQVGSGEKMLSARKFEQLIISTSGDMALMKTLHPLDFVSVKTVLSTLNERDPIKRIKDRLQAQTVQTLWDQFLRHAS